MYASSEYVEEVIGGENVERLSANLERLEEEERLLDYDDPRMVREFEQRKAAAVQAYEKEVGKQTYNAADARNAVNSAVGLEDEQKIMLDALASLNNLSSKWIKQDKLAYGLTTVRN